jgi:hypothetical protein
MCPLDKSLSSISNLESFSIYPCHSTLYLERFLGINPSLILLYPYLFYILKRFYLKFKCVGLFLGEAVSYGPPWAHCLGGYQDRLLGGPLGLLDLCHTTPDGVGRKDYGGEVLG